jgi:hypothetical protein
MAPSKVDAAVKFWPSYAIWQDGHERVFIIVKSDEFTFIVKRTRLESILPEGMFLSSAVYAVLQHDPAVSTFIVSHEGLHVSTITTF